VTVWQQLDKFRGESSIGTWIYRITSNNCLRYVEKQQRNIKIDLPVNVAEEKEHDIEPQIQFLYKCIAELVETDRVIISLELEDVNQAEIASIVGLSESNVRVKIHRIKEKLTQRFKEHGF
jgi:RNA polymerase sigma-70 factor, ECF subfamily